MVHRVINNISQDINDGELLGCHHRINIPVRTNSKGRQI
jgi:hypothetical protein